MRLHALPLLPALVAAANTVTVSVESSGGNATSPYQYGIMFEDINNSGDGGVYAELIQNRAFQGSAVYPSTLGWWYSIGGASLSLQNLSTPLSPALPTSMQVEVGSDASGDIGFWNEGFWGFPIVSSWLYNGSFYMLGDFDDVVSISLVSNTTGDTYATVSVKATSKKGVWTQFHYTFQPTSNAPDANNTLQFTMPASSVEAPLNFNLLSLFPPTYNDQPNGNRVDLMEAMAGLNPSFFRAPGGNNLEGLSNPYWWNWTTTIGPLVNRLGYPDTWGYENTNGLGLLEYMIWAEDLGMTPVLAVWSGLWLDGTVVPEDDLHVYVQAALDELEFLTGSTSTTWGALRAQYGHPAPFIIKFVEVGNEDSLNGGASTYAAYRFPMFYEAIHAAYPDIMIIASFYDVGPVTPPYNAAGDFHEYALPKAMASQFGFFDNYTAAHPLLLGEYAVTEYNQPYLTEPLYTAGAQRAYFPFWYGTCAEAIYLLGAERNSDHIIGASYAPGFMNLNRWEWIPDMIEYNANPADTILSTSYYMVKLLSGTRITENLPMSHATEGDAFWVAGRSAETGAHIFKAVVYNQSTTTFDVTFHGVEGGVTGQLTYLTAPFNSSSTVGDNIVQTYVSSVTSSKDGSFVFDMPEYSVGLFEISGFDCGFGNPSSRSGWKGWQDWLGDWDTNQ